MENNPSTLSGGEAAGGAGASLTERAGEQAQNVMRQVQGKAGDAMVQARSQLKDQANQQKERAAEGLDGIATALRTTGDQLGQQNQAFIGEYVGSAAQIVENVSHYLHDHDVAELSGEVENFARRQPAVFLGTCFALGFFAVRFLKSTSRATDGNGNGNGNGNGAGYGGSQQAALPARGTYGGTLAGAAQG